MAPVVFNKRRLISDMREVPKVKPTTLTGKLVRGTAVMSLPKGNNGLNWVIRRLLLTPTRKDMKYVSTTTRIVRDTISNRK